MTTDQLSRTFAALADPTRRDLVARLTLGDATLTELAAPYAMSLQAVSKHLTVLERAGLVSRGKDAQRKPVHLQPSVLEPVKEYTRHEDKTHSYGINTPLNRLVDSMGPKKMPRLTKSEAAFMKQLVKKNNAP